MKRISIFFGFLVCALVLAGCPEFAAPAKGSLVLSLGASLDLAGSAKTIDVQTSLDITQYNIRGSGPGGESFEELGVTASTHTQINLTPGLWDIDVDGLNGDRIILASGSAAVTIIERQTAYAAILCTPLEGEGTISLFVSWPSTKVSTPRVKAWIQSMADFSAEEPIGAGNAVAMPLNGATAQGLKSCSAGLQMVGLELHDDFGSGKLVWNTIEIAEVFASQASEGTWALLATNIDSINDGEVDINVESFLYQTIDVAINPVVTYSSSGTSVAVAATLSHSTPYYRWFLDGVEIPDKRLRDVFEPIVDPGPHTLSLVAFDVGIFGHMGGVANYRFTVGEPPEQTGTVLSWGGRGDHLGNASQGFMPAQVEGLPPVSYTMVAGGDRASFALGSDGYLWSWGNNLYGMLGFGLNVEDSPRAARLSRSAFGDSGVETISAKYNRAIAMTEEGRVYIWGEMGQDAPWPISPGDYRTVLYTPTLVSELEFSAIDVSAGYAHYGAVDDKGSIWTWGNRTNAVLGYPPTGQDQNLRPVRVPNPSSVSFEKIAFGRIFSLALDTVGRIWSWGNNSELSLGISSNEDIVENLGMVEGLTGKTIVSIHAGWYHAAAIDSSGSLYLWGGNDSGQLGNGTRTNNNTPTQIACPGGRKTFTNVYLGRNFTLAQAADDTLWVWGDTSAIKAAGSSEGYSSIPLQVKWLQGKTISTIGGGSLYCLVGIDW
jgi:alpha-tubulin suppressor-like RCC1 family protein